MATSKSSFKLYERKDSGKKHNAGKKKKETAKQKALRLFEGRLKRQETLGFNVDTLRERAEKMSASKLNEFKAKQIREKADYFTSRYTNQRYNIDDMEGIKKIIATEKEFDANRERIIKEETQADYDVIQALLNDIIDLPNYYEGWHGRGNKWAWSSNSAKAELVNIVKEKALEDEEGYTEYLRLHGSEINEQLDMLGHKPPSKEEDVKQSYIQLGNLLNTEILEGEVTERMSNYSEGF